MTFDAIVKLVKKLITQRDVAPMPMATCHSFQLRTFDIVLPIVRAQGQNGFAVTGDR